MPSGQHHSNVQAQGTFADSQLPYCGGFVDLRSSAISWSSCGSRAWSSTGRSWYILIWDDMMHQTRWEVESRSISIYYFIYSNYDRLTLISDALFASMQLCINLVSMKGLYIAVPSSCSMKHEYLAMTCRGLRKCPARFGSRGAERGGSWTDWYLYPSKPPDSVVVVCMVFLESSRVEQVAAITLPGMVLISLGEMWHAKAHQTQ